MPQNIALGNVGPADWNTKTVAIVGGGKSLEGFDFKRLDGRYTILALNASMLDIPFANAGFSIDRRAITGWWPKLRQLKFEQFYAVPDNKLGVHGAPTPLMRFIRRHEGTDFTSKPAGITGGGTTGFGALHLAFLKGARRIVLFGYDYGPGKSGWHYNEGHYTFKQAQDIEKWKQWACNFDHAAAVLKKHGVEVINASPHSAINAFPKCTIEEAMSL